MNYCGHHLSIQDLPVGVPFALSKIFPDLLLRDNPLTYWANKYLALSNLHRQREPDCEHCGLADEQLCSLSLRTVLTQREDEARQLCRFIPIFTHPRSPPRSYEWLYGLSGLLYLLRFCQANLAEPPFCLQESIEQVSKCILENSDKWAWHEKPYYGAVHGGNRDYHAIGPFKHIFAGFEQTVVRSSILSSTSSIGIGEFHDVPNVVSRPSRSILSWRTRSPGFVSFNSKRFSQSEI